MTILALPSNSRYDSRLKSDISRQQYPLTLSYATTVHKSQGMTVDALEVHCEDMWFSGLLPVAISRVRSSDNLRVINFSKRLVIPPSNSIMEAIKTPCVEIRCEISQCCETLDNSVSDTDFDYCMTDSEDELTLSVEPDEPSTSSEADATSPDQPATINCAEVTDLLLAQCYPSPVTTQQEEINRDILELLKVDISEIFHHLQTEVQEHYITTVLGNIKPSVANGVIFSSFMEKIYLMQTNELDSLMRRFRIPSRFDYYIRSMLQKMVNRHLSVEAKKEGKRNVKDDVADMSYEPSEAVLGVIRKVGGRVVHKMLRQLASSLEKLKMRPRSQKFQAYKKMKSLIETSMKCTEGEARSGTYPNTVHETTRGDRKGGRTHVTDITYELFVMLEKKRASIQTISAGMLHGGIVLDMTYHQILHDADLREKMGSIFPKSTSRMVLDQIWTLLVNRFMPIGNNEFRLQLLELAG